MGGAGSRPGCQPLRGHLARPSVRSPSRLLGLGGRRGVCQRGDHLLVIGHCLLAARALAGMIQEAPLISSLQHVQDVPGGQLLEGNVAGCLVSHDGTSPPSSASRSFSSRMAANIRDLTVPTGTPVKSAISGWV